MHNSLPDQQLVADLPDDMRQPLSSNGNFFDQVAAMFQELCRSLSDSREQICAPTTLAEDPEPVWDWSVCSGLTKSYLTVWSSSFRHSV